MTTRIPDYEGEVLTQGILVNGDPLPVQNQRAADSPLSPSNPLGAKVIEVIQSSAFELFYDEVFISYAENDDAKDGELLMLQKLKDTFDISMDEATLLHEVLMNDNFENWYTTVLIPFMEDEVAVMDEVTQELPATTRAGSLNENEAAFILASQTESPSQTFFIHRTVDNKYRWFAWPACTAFINRDQEIDSTALFDKFIEHIERTQEWPYLTFFHQEETLKMGESDFVARDGVAYLVSGLFDDSQLAQEVIRGLQSSDTHWGTSINYRPIGNPYYIDYQGKSIPVYCDGIHKEVSLLPEKAASSLFTAFPIIKENNNE